MMLRTLFISLTIGLFFAASQPVFGSATCPRTVGSVTEFVDGWPHADTWFGTNQLAVILPRNGVWPTTAPGHRISVRLFWYIDGFEAGQEGDFIGNVKRLDEGENDAIISAPTNAGGPSLGASTILTGINFPSAGCWEIIGTYKGNTLTFIVETIEHVEWRKNAT